MKRWIALSALLPLLLFAWSAPGQEPPSAPGGGTAPPPAAPTTESLPPAPATTAPAAIPTPAPRPAAPPPRATPAANTAKVTADNVNVRGQPSIYSEVVARLSRGDQVVVIEDITRENAKPGSPPEWTKISLPEGTFVWVHSGYIDPVSKAVKPTRLNVRSGPGENYSVLGRIERGTIVRDFEAQGLWLKIAAPPNAYAFVASYLVGRADPPSPSSDSPIDSPAVAATPAPQTETTPVPAVATETAPPAPAATTPEPAVTTEPEPAVAATTQEPAPDQGTETIEVVTIPEPLPPAGDPLPPALEPIEIPVPAAEEEPIEPQPIQLEKRTVIREGIVRRSVSIQAPTEFALQNEENKKVINYLLPPPSKAIVLRGFEGQRILVTGEELIDRRWPKTPVLNIDTIRSKP